MKNTSLQGIFNAQDIQNIRPSKIAKQAKAKVIVYTQEQIQEYIKNQEIKNENRS